MFDDQSGYSELSCGHDLCNFRYLLGSFSQKAVTLIGFKLLLKTYSYKFSEI